MKKLLAIAITATMMACGDRDRNSTAEENPGTDQAEAVEEYSGENISPQLEDSVNRFNVDTISSAGDAAQRRDNDLDDDTAREER